MVGSGETGAGDNFTLTKDNMDKLKDELQKTVRQLTDFDKFKNQIEMTVTSEGLRIELLETEKGFFFRSGVAEPTDDAKDLLVKMAQELGKLPNKISIEGHTDSKPFGRNRNYGNWELSSERANAARRLMQENGLGPQQVTQVRGFADQHLRKPQEPEDPANRRISVIVEYLKKEAVPIAAPCRQSNKWRASSSPEDRTLVRTRHTLHIRQGFAPIVGQAFSPANRCHICQEANRVRNSL